MINLNSLPTSFCGINSHALYDDFGCTITSTQSDVSISSGSLTIDTSTSSLDVQSVYLCAFNDGALVQGATLIEYAVCGAEILTPSIE